MAIDLSKFTDEELIAIKKGDLSKLSNESLMALKSMSATQGFSPSAAPAISAPSLDPTADAKPVESQRARMAFQGATMGWSDEIEAALRSIIPGNKYDELLPQIRAEINAYKADQPGAALAWELGGAAATGPMGLRALIGKSPTLARLIMGSAAGGAIVGGTSAAGMTEGGPLDRLLAVPAGAGIGAGLGVGGALVGKGAEVSINALMDFARRRLGGRGASIVEKEINAIMQQTGLTAEEAAAKVASGEILAENATLRDIVRAYARSGGDAQATLREALSRRPTALREGAIEQLNKYLAPGMTGNVRKAVTESDEALKALENAMYESAYKKGAVFTAPLLDAMSAAVKRTRGRAAADLEEAYTAQTGNTPFFKINEKGEVMFDRAPTLRDAEILRRSLRDLQGQAYSSGRGAAGEGYKEAEQALRGQIDVASPAVAGARAQAAERRSAKDMFESGKGVFSQNADQVDIDFGKMMQSGDQNAIRYYRMGAMDAIRARMSGGNRTTMLRKLSDPETKEGQILRHIFPGDQLEQVLGTLGRATQSAQAAGQVLGGSATAPTMLHSQRIGQAGIGADEIGQAMAGNLFVLPNIARKLINQLAPKNLSEKQRQQVAQLLVSEDPRYVLNALKDQSGMAQLQMLIARATSRLPGAGMGLSVLGGNAGVNIMNGQ